MFNPNQPRDAEGQWSDAGLAIQKAASDKKEFNTTEKDYSNYEKAVSNDSIYGMFKINNVPVKVVEELETPIKLPMGRVAHAKLGFANGKHIIFIKSGLTKDQFKYAIEHEFNIHIKAGYYPKFLEEYPEFKSLKTS